MGGGSLMNIVELKKNILSLNLPEHLLVFVCEDNYFLANHYIDYYCTNTGTVKNYIDNIQDAMTSNNSLFSDFEPTLNILKVDTFDCAESILKDLQNTIIICKKSKVITTSETEDYFISIPKLTDWQITDYIEAECPGINTKIGERAEANRTMLAYFQKHTNNDIYKIKTELDKVKLFEESLQPQVLEQLLLNIESDIYDVGDVDLFLSNELENASSGDKTARNNIATYLVRHNSQYYDPIAVTNLLLGHFKKLMYVSAESGIQDITQYMSAGQARYLGRVRQKYTSDELRAIIKFLTNIDLRLKSSKLELSKERFIDYLVCRLARFK
jgi:DNA polymerase III delta subunit